MPKSRFPFWSAAFLLIHAITSTAQFDFSGYTQCAQPILYNLAPTQCASSNVYVLNECLCTNEGYLVDSARNVLRQCGCADLKSFADTNIQNCARTGTPSIVDHEGLIKSATGKSTCGNDDLGGGVIAGIVIGVVSALLVVVFGCLQFAAQMGWVNERYGPWPKIKRCLCCCCGR